MEYKLFQTAKHEINDTVLKSTASGFNLSQRFFCYGQHWAEAEKAPILDSRFWWTKTFWMKNSFRDPFWAKLWYMKFPLAG